MISKNELLHDLEFFKEIVGKPVIVHTSLKSIGEIEGGADTLLDALIEFFCRNDGLVCIPTHTWKSLKLDLINPESCLGVLPTIAANRTDGVRSMHPTHSIKVFGNREKAENFVKDEIYSESPTSPIGCYGNLLREGGYVLLIGVNQTKNTFLHCVEEMLDVSERLTEDKLSFDIIHQDGNVEERSIHWFDTTKISDVSKYFGKFEPAFRHFGAITYSKIGNACVQMCSTEIMKKTMDVIYANAKGKELLEDNSALDETLYIKEVLGNE